MNTDPTREDALTLEILDAIDRRSDVSQRGLAQQLGVALGLANSYLKRCVRKGYIKVSQAPANRLLYFLTPKGFTEKSRLTASYLRSSLTFYRQASASCARVFEDCRAHGWQRTLFYGVSDLAEIALVRAMEAEVEVVGLCDPDAPFDYFMKRPVWRSLSEAAPFDVCIVTDMTAPAATATRLADRLDSGRLLVPDVLRVDLAPVTAQAAGT